MGKKVVIVGGVAGGASAAARLRRLDEDAEIIMFERGEHISYANCGLPYYVGGIIRDRKKLLVQTPEAMSKRFNIDVRTMSEVVRVFPEERQVEVKDLAKGEVYKESYDYLVLSPGASPIVPDIPGAELKNVFTIRNVPDSDAIKAYVETRRPTKAAVVGGGFVGLEMVEVLMACGTKVTLIEADTQVMRALDPEMAAVVHCYLRDKGVDLHLGDKLVAIKGSSEVEKIELASGKSLEAELVILGIGVRPEVRLAKEAGLAIGPTGGILVDEYLRTSDTFIYAVGDAIQVKDYVTGEDALIPLAGPANRQGRIVADTIAGRPTPYKGSQGTAIVKIIDMVAAVTGSNEKTLKRLGIDYLSCHTHPAPHATYYPGGTQMFMKLLFTPEEGRILGAQIVGYEGVDKRIDVLATAIRAGMTVFDLQDLQLAYAPPFSSAKDPVNMIGYVAGNVIKGDVEIVHWHEVESRLNAGALLLDVRTKREVEEGKVAGALNIPVDNLRERIHELPKDREILVYCQVGLRSYIAYRILRHNGFKAKSISGGYRTYQMIENDRNR